MFYVCAARFSMTGNLEKICKFLESKQGLNLFILIQAVPNLRPCLIFKKFQDSSSY